MTHEHSFVQTGDLDSFPQIQDRNGEVVLSYCRICQKGEGQLLPDCPGPPTGHCDVCGCLTYDDHEAEEHDSLTHRAKNAGA